VAGAVPPRGVVPHGPSGRKDTPSRASGTPAKVYDPASAAAPPYLPAAER